MIDWDGYTIGYYGRPFEARNKPKGSSFDDGKKDFVRFTLGNDLFIPAFEEAIKTMKVGRRTPYLCVVPRVVSSTIH